MNNDDESGFEMPPIVGMQGSFSDMRDVAMGIPVHQSTANNEIGANVVIPLNLSVAA